MGLKIKNETVYVIYHNGQPYDNSGRKIVYTSKGAAKGVITNDAKDNARYTKGYYDLSHEQKEKLIEENLMGFEIVEYTPKGK